MTARNLLFEHRHKLVPALIAVVLAVVGVAFRVELGAWFSGTPPTGGPAGSASAVASSSASAPAGTKATTYRFDDATLERLRAAFAAYEQVRARLAEDSHDGLEGLATSIRAALDAASEGTSALPAALAAALSEAETAARALGEARDAKQARDAFGELSRHLVTLAASDSRLVAGLHLFECPMTEGYAKWFQPSQQVHNPYMGESMPTCGSPAAWAEPGDEHAHPHGAADEIAYYTCSMHPSVRRDGPGQCPICGMQLTPVMKTALETGTIIVDEVRRQRIGVRTATVAKRTMTLKVRAVGAVRYDESRLFDVNLRMSGWVQRLFVDETGQRVKAGQTMFTLYSPELYAAQLEHLSARRSQADGGSEMLANLARTSRQRLRLLGMNEAQISELEQRGEARENVPIPSPASGHVIEKYIVDGARVEAGMRVYRIADLRKVWIDAELYETDLPHVRVGQPARVELPYAESAEHTGKVDYVYPTLEAQTRTGRARVVLENPDLELKPDMYANVVFDVELGERLTVEDSAVIYTGPRRLVFVDLGEGRLRPKAVEVGAHVGGYYEVIDGLSEGDLVVTSGNFLIAAESRIRSATRYWETTGEPE
jgi:Cu(I)/Ag(I) efflux system membrane fusion protein